MNAITHIIFHEIAISVKNIDKSNFINNGDKNNNNNTKNNVRIILSILDILLINTIIPIVFQIN